MRTVLLGALALLLCVPVLGEVLVNDVQNINLPVLIPCTGSVIQLSGPLHELITYTINGNTVSGQSLFNPQGISGIDPVTGAKYQATGGTQDHFQGSMINGKFTETFVNNFRIIGQGSAPSLLVHDVAHVTINANGDVTVVHQIDSAECR